MGQGEQWLIDIYDFPNIQAERCKEILIDAVKIMKATMVGSFSYEGNTERTSFVILDESHLSIHDYRNGKAALDMFTCGGKKMDKGFKYIKQEINFKNHEKIRKLERF